MKTSRERAVCKMMVKIAFDFKFVASEGVKEGVEGVKSLVSASASRQYH